MNKLFPSIPSFLELNIFDYTGFCQICKYYTNHDMTNCEYCGSVLCLEYSEGIWKIVNGKYICFLCRIKHSNFSFEFVPNIKHN